MNNIALNQYMEASKQRIKDFSTNYIPRSGPMSWYKCILQDGKSFFGNLYFFMQYSKYKHLQEVKGKFLYYIKFFNICKFKYFNI